MRGRSLFLAGLIFFQGVAFAKGKDDEKGLREARETYARFWGCRAGAERRYACFRDVFDPSLSSDETLKYDFLLNDEFSEVELESCPSDVAQVEERLYKQPPSERRYCFAYSRAGSKRWGRVYFSGQGRGMKILRITL